MSSAPCCLPTPPPTLRRAGGGAPRCVPIVSHCHFLLPVVPVVLSVWFVVSWSVFLFVCSSVRLTSVS